MPSAYLTDIQTRHQVYLERLKSGEARDFNRIIKQLDAAVVAAIDKLRGQEISDVPRSAINAIIRELETAHKALLRGSIEGFNQRMRNIAAYETLFEADALAAVAPSIANTVAAVSAVNAYAAALERPMAMAGQLMPDFIASMADRDVAAISNLIRRAHTESWTTAQMFRTLRGTKALNYRDGMLTSMKRGHESVVRTSIQHVSSTARFETWKANSDVVTGYRWVSTLDSHTTLQCQSLDGQVFEVGDGPIPPIHVNCRSTTVAELREGLNVLSRGRTRASAAGQIDARTTYYTWLKQQPAAVQDSILGPKRGKLFRNGGLSSEEFARLSLSKTFEPLTLEEMKALQPTAFLKAGL